MSDFERLKGSLAIDKDVLDDCLLQQPQLYYHVGEALAQAIAKRDALKLRIEEKSAVCDAEVRNEATRAGDKVTEAYIQRKLAAHPDLAALSSQLLDASTRVSEWSALKEAYGQRSYMLRELVALYLAERRDLGAATGDAQAHAALSASKADSNRAAAGAMRRKRLGGG